MTLSNNEKALNGMLDKAGKIYIVQKHQTNFKIATEQQPAFMMISTINENDYLRFVKLSVIPVDNKDNVNIFMCARLSAVKVLNIDNETIFTDLSKELTLNSEKIIYSEENQRLK